MAFRGSFDYSLDAKNRLTVPAKFRAELSGGVVLAKGLERNIDIWVPDAYDAHVQRSLAGLNPMSPDARQLRMWFSANAFDTELDAAGRVQVPPKLIEHAGLRKDVVVTGASDSLQVWDRATWEEFNDRLTGEIAGITERLGHPG
jgi:MraZ protein